MPHPHTLRPATTACRVVPALAILLVLTLPSCRSGGADEPPMTQQLSLHDVPDDAWRRLAESRIFFGHQSVGFNIVDGMRDVMAADPRIALRIVESKQPDTLDAGFVHAAIGRNRHPGEKDDEFAAIVDRGLGRPGDVALYKYCYLDAAPSTDVAAMFDAYRHNVAAVQARHPSLRIVHVTQPVAAVESAIEARLRALLGRSSARALNAKRNAFNRLLLAEYGASGMVFDLAAAESTRPDGSRHFFVQGADTVWSLVPEYTDDGGHLAGDGRRIVAERFLAFLAALPPAGDA